VTEFIHSRPGWVWAFVFLFMLVAALGVTFQVQQTRNDHYLNSRREASDRHNAVVAQQQIATRAAICIVLDSVPDHNPIIERAKHQMYPVFGGPAQLFCPAIPKF
jgi:hypothetical protein